VVKAVVLAGGLGTRLASVIGEVPKPMAPVGSRPFLEYLLDYLSEQRIESVVLAVSYRWEAIRDHFGGDYRGMELHYSVEDLPLGTGGAIRQALGLVADLDVVVLNGDTLFSVDLNRLAGAHQEHGALLTIALKRMADSGRFGRVEVVEGGEIFRFQEKGPETAGWINGGTYMVNRGLFDRFPMADRFSFELDLIEPNISQIRPRAFFSQGDFIDMGIPEEYARAQREIGLDG